MNNLIHTIYLIHHSHTDVGYTHDQPIVWELQSRFLDEAIRMAERYADHESPGAFRWTVETTAVLQYWLRHTSDHDIERLIALERAGRVEITGMFANITPLFDSDQLIESFQILRSLREDYGFTIQYAMNCDVNGENWPLADILLDMGLRGFTMAINTHFGGALRPRPSIFYWEGPSGRKIPVNNGWTYDKGWREGIGRNIDEFRANWPRLQEYLHQIGYPLPILLLQSYHPYGDNGSAYDFTPFIDEWNAGSDSPRIVMATPRIWWSAVEEYAQLLATYRGDWTDFWNFGCVSSAREQGINRASRIRLRAADALHAVVKSLPVSEEHHWATRTFERYRNAAWEALNLWDEHTWGADVAVRNPQSEDTATQWHHKAGYAYQARSLGLMLQRDALADFAQHISRENENDLLLFNPLPWRRIISGEVPHFITHPRGLPDDTTAGRHHQDRIQPGEFVLPPTEVPGFGYRAISRDSLIDTKTPATAQNLFSGKAAMSFTEDATVENHRYRVTFDRENGGIAALYDKKLDWEWVDDKAGMPFNGYVYERVADATAAWPRELLFYQDWLSEKAEIPSGWKPGWRPIRSRPVRVITHRVYKTPLAIIVEQTLDAPGCASPLTQRARLPHHEDYIECESSWEMGLNDHPEATYIAFPFHLPDAVARFDVGGQAVIPGEQQLPGVCRDYFTVQGWVDFSNAERGVTIALPENPMTQLGDFHFGHYQSEFKLESALLLGWVTNNYWETNFRAHQPGPIRARYRILPHGGIFEEAQAHRFALEAANTTPLLQHLGEPAAQSPLLPEQGQLLQLPQPPIITLRVKPSEREAGIILRLLNASDEPQTAHIRSGLMRINRAHFCNPLEAPQQDLPVHDGAVALELSARQIGVIHLDTRFERSLR